MTAKIEVRDGVVYSTRRQGTLLLDLEDYEMVQARNGHLGISWRSTKDGTKKGLYVFVNLYDRPKRTGGPRTQIGREWLHRLIMAAPAGMVVDHINKNTLDNRRVNLRVCTRQENLQGRKKHSTNTTGFKGVVRASGGFCAQIKIRGEISRFGPFVAKEVAAAVYDLLAMEHFGEYAYLNFQKTTTLRAVPYWNQVKALLGKSAEEVLGADGTQEILCNDGPT